ncbi:hypothetical protein BD779DRAFT_199671 [Infundibulicybe gibba]|nr:hypothetical protein BD779DRAFT_199671 [Infundibulicybe gibba]
MEPTVLASVLLFMIVTAHWVNTIYRLFEAFGAGSMEASMLFLLDQSKTSDIVEFALTFSAGVLGDFVIIYRVWTISSHNRAAVAFPIISAIGMTAIFFAVVYQLVRTGLAGNIAKQLELISLLDRWVTLACAFTISTNVYCSGFITWTLWSTHRQTGAGTSGDGIMRAAAMVIESATIYTSWVIFFFITYKARLDMNTFAGILWPYIAGISIMLINARVGLNRINKFNLVKSFRYPP